MLTRRNLLATGAALSLPLPARAAVGIPPVQLSGSAVELVDWLTLPHTNSSKPYTGLNQLKAFGGYLWACDTRGKLYRINPATKATKLWLDMVLVRNGALEIIDINAWWGGFRDFVFNP